MHRHLEQTGFEELCYHQIWGNFYIKSLGLPRSFWWIKVKLIAVQSGLNFMQIIWQVVQWWWEDIEQSILWSVRITIPSLHQTMAGSSIIDKSTRRMSDFLHMMNAVNPVRCCSYSQLMQRLCWSKAYEASKWIVLISFSD